MMLVGLTVLALMVAPIVVPPAAVLFLLFPFEDSDDLMSALPNLPLILLTYVGLFGYGCGFVACLIFGVPLTFVAERFANLRPVWVWVSIGALGGALAGALLSGMDSYRVVVAGVATGATTALIFRLIVGFGFREREAG